MFPEITNIGGVRADSLKWHPSGLALDIMIPGAGGLNDPTPPAAKAEGDRIWAWLQQNASALGLDINASLWQQKDHFNHIHAAFFGNNNPGPDGTGLLNFPGLPGGMSGLSGFAGYGGLPGTGIPGLSAAGAQPVTWQDLPTRIAQKYQEAFQPANLNKFLLGQASNVGQSLMAIGQSFLSGFTGIDISSLTSAGQQIMQHFTGESGSGGAPSSLAAGSPMDSAISGDLDSFMPGASALGAGPNVMGGVNLGSIVGAATAGRGAGSGAPGITNAGVSELQRLAQQLLLQAGFPASEWPPFKNIVDHESSWSPTARNASGAFGLGQFLGHENDVYGQMGAYTTDPVKQLTAMIQYIKDRYGTPSAAWAHWQQNNSYAAGGGVKSGPIRVSRGEYRMSPAAVKRLGPGFMQALNGFEFGGMPFMQGMVMPKPAPPPPVPPGPNIMPMRPTPGAQPGGPLPTTPTAPTPGANQNGPVAPPVPPPGVGVPAPAPAPGGPAEPPPPPPSIGAGGVMTPAPVPQGPNMVDPALAAMQRGGVNIVGPAPQTNQHLAQGWKGAIEGGFDAAGQVAATAGSLAGGMIPGAGQAGALAQQALHMAGQFASGLANVAASAGVGTIDQIGTQATPSGAPLLPTIAPQQFSPMQSPDAAALSAPVTQSQLAGVGGGGPAIVNNYFGGIHTQNMDEWQRRQQLLERQQEQPLTNAYVH
jgi:hypothetical protein